MQVDINKIIKFSIRLGIFITIFGVVIPLLSAVSTSNLYQKVIESTKSKYDLEFPTILRSPQSISPEIVTTGIQKQGLSFAFPLTTLHGNTKYGLPEIELFFTIKERSPYPTCHFELEIQESVVPGRGVRQGKTQSLRSNILTVNNCLGKGGSTSFFKKFLNYIFSSDQPFNGPIKVVPMNNNYFRVKIDSDTIGNVQLTNPRKYLEVEKSVYHLQIDLIQHALPGSTDFDDPILVFSDGSHLELRQDYKQMNGVKKLFVTYKITTNIILFISHYLLLGLSVLLSTTFFSFIL